MQGYICSSKREDMDLQLIHGFLTNSPWAKGISLEDVTKALDYSLPFGAFTDSGEQIGFGRVLTDFVTFAYMTDGFVREDHKGKGIAKWLMQEIMDDQRLQNVRRMLIATTATHGLFEKFGFKVIKKPENLMEKWNWQAYEEL